MMADTSSRRPRRTVAAVGAFGVACVAYGTFIERRWYRIRHLVVPDTLRMPGKLRILHISDVHLIASQQDRIEFLAALAGEDYDLVVATGDLLGATDTEDIVVDALAPLTTSERPGLVVLGSNDFYGPVLKSPLSYFLQPHRRTHGEVLDTKRLVHGLEANGWQVLRNSTTVVSMDQGDVAVGGIDDPHLSTTKIPSVAEVAPPATPTPLLHLGLVHAPYTQALDTLVAGGHDLLLAGHTHGGQVRFPPVGALVGNCDLPLSQVRGLSRYDNTWLHVSPGLGHSMYAPFRFACRPEATILELW